MLSRSLSTAIARASEVTKSAQITIKGLRRVDAKTNSQIDVSLPLALAVGKPLGLSRTTSARLCRSRLRVACFPEPERGIHRGSVLLPASIAFIADTQARQN